MGDETFRERLRYTSPRSAPNRTATADEYTITVHLLYRRYMHRHSRRNHAQDTLRTVLDECSISILPPTTNEGMVSSEQDPNYGIIRTYSSRIPGQHMRAWCQPTLNDDLDVFWEKGRPFLYIPEAAQGK